MLHGVSFLAYSRQHRLLNCRQTPGGVVSIPYIATFTFPPDCSPPVVRSFALFFPRSNTHRLRISLHPHTLHGSLWRSRTTTGSVPGGGWGQGMGWSRKVFLSHVSGTQVLSPLVVHLPHVLLICCRRCPSPGIVDCCPQGARRS